jgi:hypothetical protein
MWMVSSLVDTLENTPGGPPRTTTRRTPLEDTLQDDTLRTPWRTSRGHPRRTPWRTPLEDLLEDTPGGPLGGHA